MQNRGRRGAELIRGATALVTGASSGIGMDIARELAARGAHLILVARREELLRGLAEELAGRHGVRVEVLAADLAAEDAPRRLYERVAALGRQVDVLVNNAGFGVFGGFAETSWERERNMVELNIISLLHMTKLFVADMVARNRGYVLQVASVAGFQPTPMLAGYGATKAFVLNFGEALSWELRRTNVSCTVLAPGFTATEFFAVAGQGKLTLFQRLSMMPSARVAQIGVEAMLARRPSVVAGLANKLLVWSSRLVPRRLSAMAASRLIH